MSVHGSVADGFENVREEFAAVASDAQLAVYRHGRPVVDLWAGEVTGDSLFALYSSAKGAAHLVVATLVRDGVLDLDRAVADYWPEFAAEGKGELTLRELLAHRSGVIGTDDGFTLEELADDQLLAERLAGQRPYWKPGSAYGYHAWVIGALAGEVVRRATGRSIQDLYRERIRDPFQLDFHLGLPEELEPRYVPVLPGPPQPAPRPGSLPAISFNQHTSPPADLVTFANTRRARALGPTSSGGIGNARGLARMYAAAIGEVDGRAALLDPSTLAAFTTTPWTGTDLVTGEQDHFLIGFEAQGVRYPELGPDAFGHSGAVGAQSFADPASGIAYSYTVRRFVPGGGGGAPENHRLVKAVFEASGRV